MNNTQDRKLPVYINDIENIEGISEDSVKELKEVAEKYRFRANDYYLSLINWEDPDDPIKRLIIPHTDELDTWGQLDPSGEHNYTVLPGLEHKYSSTALMLVSNVCGGICRYCFRKRVFMKEQDAVLHDYKAAAEYIRDHTEVTNLLLTGGDPLMLSPGKLESIITPLLDIDHLKIIRLGTKMAAFNPEAILDKPGYFDLIKTVENSGKQIYIMTHFNHVRELTPLALKVVREFRAAGAVVANQTPIIKGVNDSVQALTDLFRELSFSGIPPYYVFQCRPASGNKEYAVPVEEGYRIFEEAKTMVSGLAKRARFVMSHMSGKVEICGMDKEQVYMKYHRAAVHETSGSFMVMKRNPDAYWLDDYKGWEKSITLKELR